MSDKESEKRAAAREAERQQRLKSGKSVKITAPIQRQIQRKAKHN